MSASSAIRSGTVDEGKRPIVMGVGPRAGQTLATRSRSLPWQEQTLNINGSHVEPRTQSSCRNISVSTATTPHGNAEQSPGSCRNAQYSLRRVAPSCVGIGGTEIPRQARNDNDFEVIGNCYRVGGTNEIPRKLLRKWRSHTRGVTIEAALLSCVVVRHGA